LIHIDILTPTSYTMVLIVNYCSDSLFIHSLNKRYLKLDIRTYCTLRKI